ncbi:hypothetical protein D3C76_906630 [compost metagenome]
MSVAPHVDGAIRLLVPDKVRHLEGAPGVIEQLIAGARTGEVRDRPVGVVRPLGQQEGEPALVTQPGQQAAQGGMLLADGQARSQGAGELSAQQFAGTGGGRLDIVHVAREPAAQVAVIASVQGEGLPLAGGSCDGEGGAAAGIEVQHQVMVDEVHRLAGDGQ